jgi:hypothetical protein
MATSTTQRQKPHFSLRQRAEISDLHGITDCAVKLDAEDNHTLLAAFSAVIQGLHLTHSAGNSFSLSAGLGLLKGEVIKSTSSEVQVLDDNTDPSNSRIDRMEIVGFQEELADNATKFVLSGMSRSQFGSPSPGSVGTGDGSTTVFNLPHGNADLRSMKVYLAGTLAGGWNLSNQSGSGGVDQLVFGTAPGAGVAITASFDYLSGGVEAPATVKTRKTIKPLVNILKGTPGAGAPAWTTGSLKLAQITLAPSWSGGAYGAAIDNSVKQYLVAEDNHANTQSAIDSNEGGRLLDAIRNIHGICSGLRLYYVGATEVVVSPGFGVFHGRSFYLNEPLSQGSLSLGSAGWRYAYLTAPRSSSGLPGTVPTLSITDTAPNARGERPGGSQPDFYIGALYWTGTAVREFYTRGSWVFWKTSVDKVLTVPQAPVDLDVSDAAPETGRTLLCSVRAGLGSPGSGSGTLDVLVNSMRQTNSSAPKLRHHIGLNSNDSAIGTEQQGVILVEQNSSTRYVNYESIANDTTTGESATLKVQGYLDDHRTLDKDGLPLFY